MSQRIRNVGGDSKLVYHKAKYAVRSSSKRRFVERLSIYRSILYRFVIEFPFLQDSELLPV